MRIRILDQELYGNDNVDGKWITSYPGDAGIDLRARKGLSIIPGQVPLGVAVEIPGGYVGRLTARSSTSYNNGYQIISGTIDSSYRGELIAICYPLNGSDASIKIGDRIAQLVILPIASPDQWQVIGNDEGLSNTSRGEAGLGSTGVQ